MQSAEERQLNDAEEAAEEAMIDSTKDDGVNAVTTIFTIRDIDDEDDDDDDGGKVKEYIRVNTVDEE